MGTFLTFLGIIFVILVIKFIWDSYLTDNTEKRWREYKRQTPAEAERIEANTGLNLKNSPYDSNLRSKPGDLKKRVPKFIDFYSQLHPAIRAKVSASDATRFEFRMPISLYGNIVGYNHVGVLDRNGTFEMYFYTLSIYGKKLQLNPYKFESDLTVDEYEQQLYEFSKTMGSNPEYLQVATGNA